VLSPGEISVWAVLPFALTLLGIAVLPLIAPHFWEKNRNKAIVAAAVAVPMGIYLAVVLSGALIHSAIEYASFMALLGSLYVIAGGIHVTGDLRASPATNVTILAIGAVIANLVGTTGASMLLIRVVLRTNQQRKHVSHIPFFFILVVSNCGGLLTPLGDPPLFLGYLRGVPFVWTLGLWPVWIFAVGYLLLVFFVMDRRAYAKELTADIARDQSQRVPLSVEGLVNLPLLCGVIGSVFLPSPWRELAMVALAGLSIVLGPRTARRANGFTYGPILEVAILFAAIFVTMVPALGILEARGAELGVTEPWQFFLATGTLSSVLDNAPTYLTFLSTAMALDHDIATMAVGDGALPPIFLAAISTSAVLMGANTYIGNGPNFMVKAIAEEAGVKMPSFFGYAGRAILTLAPIYVVLTIYFVLRG
jgi:Na+/H+ antiporter NhaD/arsenite permease-like protein